MSVRTRSYVRFDLVSVRDAVGAAEDVHHRDDLADGHVVQPEPLHGGAVGVDSVLAVVGDRDRQGDDLLGQQVELARFHNCLKLLPGGLQVVRVDRQRLPEVGHEVDLLGGHDVLVNRLHLAGGLLFRDRAKKRHF